jgi:hypothetical protein
MAVEWLAEALIFFFIYVIIFSVNFHVLQAERKFNPRAFDIKTISPSALWRSVVLLNCCVLSFAAVIPIGRTTDIWVVFTNDTCFHFVMLTTLISFTFAVYHLLGAASRVVDFANASQSDERRRTVTIALCCLLSVVFVIERPVVLHLGSVGAVAYFSCCSLTSLYFLVATRHSYGILRGYLGQGVDGKDAKKVKSVAAFTRSTNSASLVSGFCSLIFAYYAFNNLTNLWIPGKEEPGEVDGLTVVAHCVALFTFSLISVVYFKAGHYFKTPRGSAVARSLGKLSGGRLFADKKHSSPESADPHQKELELQSVKTEADGISTHSGVTSARTSASLTDTAERTRAGNMTAAENLPAHPTNTSSSPPIEV